MFHPATGIGGELMARDRDRRPAVRRRAPWPAFRLARGPRLPASGDRGRTAGTLSFDLDAAGEDGDPVREMGRIERKSLDHPDEVRELSMLTMHFVRVGSLNVGRGIVATRLALVDAHAQ